MNYKLISVTGGCICVYNVVRGEVSLRQKLTAMFLLTTIYLHGPAVIRLE